MANPNQILLEIESATNLGWTYDQAADRLRRLNKIFPDDFYKAPGEEGPGEVWKITSRGYPILQAVRREEDNGKSAAKAVATVERDTQTGRVLASQAANTANQGKSAYWQALAQERSERIQELKAEVQELREENKELHNQIRRLEARTAVVEYQALPWWQRLFGRGRGQGPGNKGKE